MPKVYVINAGPHDYSGAERFGELVFCTHGVVDKLDLSQMHRELSECMKDSEPTDFILLTSLTSLCSVACSIFSVRHHELHLLIYKSEDYVVRSLFFDKPHKGNRNERSALTS